MSEELKPCPVKMIEIYSGKDPEWEGYYNLLINDDDQRPIAGPLSPYESAPLLKLIEAWNTRPAGVESWPDWKKDYKLTENSAPQNEKE